MARNSRSTHVIEKEEEPKANAWWHALGVFVLMGAIIGGSSIGAVANFVPVETSFAKNAWRSGLVTTIFIIPVLVEWRIKRRTLDYRSLISVKQYGFLLATLSCQVLWTFGLIYASLNTIQSQAYVFNNIHGLFIVLINYMVGTIPSKYEWLGVILAVMGCGFMIMDPQAARSGSGQSASIVPAIVDICSAFFGAIYFLMSARNVKTIPICLLILIMNMHTWFINSCIAKSQNPAIEIFSFNVDTGCLGFLNLTGNDPLTLSMYAIFCSFFGSAGYILVLLFYSALVTSNAYLIEPFFAQVLGYMLGLDMMPGLMTLIGTVFAVFGIMYIDKGARLRGEIEKNRAKGEMTLQE